MRLSPVNNAVFTLVPLNAVKFFTSNSVKQFGQNKDYDFCLVLNFVPCMGKFVLETHTHHIMIPDLITVTKTGH